MGVLVGIPVCELRFLADSKQGGGCSRRFLLRITFLLCPRDILGSYAKAKESKTDSSIQPHVLFSRFTRSPSKDGSCATWRWRQ